MIQYRSAIFYHSAEQKSQAQQVIDSVKGNFHPGIATTLEEAGPFYAAEGYHQDYLSKNPHGYECATHFERTWESIKKQMKYKL